ncbi:hypothetical protein MNBD_GAMMA03-268 [hydrothermal vent metagenome]|uniref:Uncharacterized protein n=1 Tax=hydrothermal vent metagenome TaxID=652676 RepID=A0A3B0VRZ6_9ZZZZ
MGFLLGDLGVGASYEIYLIVLEYDRLKSYVGENSEC